MLLSGALFADQVIVKWKYNADYGSFWTPADWSDGRNWDGGVAPASRGLGAGDAGNFANCTDWQYVRIPDAGASFWRYEGGEKKVMLVGGKILSEGIRGSSQTWVYCDVGTVNENPLSTQGAVYAGDTSAIGKWQSSVDAYSRLDLWATSADEVRVNPSCTGEYQYSAGFHLIGAQGNDATNGVWAKVDNDARFLTYVSGAKISRAKEDYSGAFGAGVTVHGTGVPDGTFVRRVYPTLNMIELSSAVDWQEATEVALTIDAYSPKVSQRISSLSRWGTENKIFYTGKFRDQDDYRIEVFLTTQDNAFPIDFQTPVGLKPATIVIRDSYDYWYQIRNRSYKDKPVWMGDVHLEFGTSRPDETPGLQNLCFKPGTAASALARLTVTGELAAVVGTFTNFVATVVKDGTGSLALSNATGSANAQLRVEEGSLRLSALPTCASVELKNLSVTPGADFTVAAGTTVAVDDALAAGTTVTLEEGATLDLHAAGLQIGADVTICGAGEVLVGKLPVLEGVTLDGPLIRIVSPGAASDVLPFAGIEGGVPGDPAFWVDAAKNVGPKYTMGTWTDCVSFWRDCRWVEGEDAYSEYYATNDFSQVDASHGWAPSRLQGTSAKPYVSHIGDVQFATDAQGKGNFRYVCSGMVWSKPITNIYAVFSVEYVNNGAQAVLGSTKNRFASILGAAATVGDFRRAANSNEDGGGIGTWNKPYLLSDKAAACVREGLICLDGIQRTSRDTLQGVGAANSSIHLFEFHPNGPGGRADAFAMQENAGITCSGLQYQHEVIIYTNRLSALERQQVRQYLMKKWMGVDASGMDIHDYNRFSGGAEQGKLTLDEGATCEIASDSGIVGFPSVDGTGTLVKSGGGKALIDYVAGASLDVRGGEVVVRSTTLDASVIPSGAFIHLDANATNRITLVDTNFPDWGMQKMVEKWLDCDGKAAPYARRRLTDGRYGTGFLSWPAELGGKAVVDYGYFRSNSSDTWRFNKQGLFSDFYYSDAGIRNYTNTTTIGSVFVLIGSKNGGGNPLGGDGGATWRDNGGAKESAFLGSSAPSGLRSGSGWINGVKKDLTVTGLSGGYDLVSAYPSSATLGKIAGLMFGNWNIGGGELGEVLVYEQPLSLYDHQLVDMYLNGKWFGRAYNGFAPSSVGTLSVACGAKVTVDGGAPLAVAALGEMGGTVDGSLTLAANATIDITIADGAVLGVTVSGDVDFSKGGTVVVHGNPKELAAGAYPLVTAADAEFGEATWMLDVETPYRGRVLTLRTTETGLVLDVVKAGALLIVR